MRYWQHGETGSCCAVDDSVDLSRRHIEITKEQYDLTEGAKNTDQQVQADEPSEYPDGYGAGGVND